MTMTRRTFVGAITGTVLAATSQATRAQTYPSRPVRLIVAFVPSEFLQTLSLWMEEKGIAAIEPM